jgi:hypothetical protein
MKYIKTFEKKYNEKIYWSVKKDEYIFKKSLEKIDCPEYFIKQVIDNFNIFSGDVLYVSFNSVEKYEENEWDVTAINWLDSGGYKYMGEIKLTHKELKDIEIQKNLDKYNL